MMTTLVLLYHGGNDIVSRAIRFFTRKPWTHSAVYIGDPLALDLRSMAEGGSGATYEDTVWEAETGKWWTAHDGVRKTSGRKVADRVLQYRRQLFPDELTKMQVYAELQVSEKRPYNFLKLVALAVVYPTRWFWDAIGYVPFQSFLWGDVCSGFVCDVFSAAGINLFPALHTEAAIAPGDLADCSELVPTSLVPQSPLPSTGGGSATT